MLLCEFFLHRTITINEAKSREELSAFKASRLASIILIDHRARDKSATEYGKRFNASISATGLRYFCIEYNHVRVRLFIIV